YLSKNVTVRLVYASPKVGDNWRKLVKRDRVRFWAVEHDVMKGWRAQMKPDTDLPGQDRFWKWVRDNVDYRVRRGVWSRPVPLRPVLRHPPGLGALPRGPSGHRAHT